MWSSSCRKERTSLPFADQVLLWTMRAWVVGVHKNISTAELLQTAFLKADAPGAAPYLDRFMHALAEGASRAIQINCFCQPSVSLDERLVLSVLALHQAHRSFEAVVLLRTLMDREGTMRAGEEADALARRLRDDGLILSLPAPRTSRHAFFERALEGLSSNATLH